MNPKGKGCCFYHICVSVLCKRLRAMTKEKCMVDFKPCIDWECACCLSMHSHNEDADTQECVMCGEPHEEQMPTSACSLDDNSGELAGGSNSEDPQNDDSSFERE